MNKLEWYEQINDTIIGDIEEFYSSFYSGQEVSKVGSSYRLEPCPMCGHSKCCTVGVAVHCFSCNWSGTHINAWYDYATTVLGISLFDAIQKLSKFAKLPFPSGSKEDFERYQKFQRKQAILKSAESFYHDQLLNCNEKFKFNEQELTPLNYLLTIRKRKIESLKEFKVGFSYNYKQLSKDLRSSDYSDDEIKEAKIWVPEGLFVFFYKHPTTKNIIRVNTKNPFEIKNVVSDGLKRIETDEVIQGFSVGEKAILFSPRFSFKKPYAIVEGEHDIISLTENGCDNVCCIGGNLKNEAYNILNKTESTIYALFDNDKKGREYEVNLNKLFPEKDIRSIRLPDEYKDPDEYFKANPEPMPWTEIIKDAKILDTEDFKCHHNNIEFWVCENRFKKLTFEIKAKTDKNFLVGQVNLYADGKLIDREDNVALIKCKTKMKPMNFILSDKIDEYFNSDLDNKAIEELIDIYWYSSRKQTIESIIAKRIFESNNDEEIINSIKVKMKSYGVDNNDIVDSILKEVNDMQNKSIARYSNIPKIKISQYFNVRNNDAYFYFNYVKDDGGARRKLPFLIRNDKALIRLDLLRRKDEQCLILIDNKYELPLEVPNALFDFDDCSLTQDVVEDYMEGVIPKDELEPGYLIKQIENYVKKFYCAENDNVYKILALYCFMTYFYELFGQIPYLHLQGLKGSGKSVLDSILKMFCFNAKLTVNMSDAALFRMASIEGGTIILDEVENLTVKSKVNDSIMASVLKGGYTRGFPVYRVNLEKGINDKFDCFCPKIISNIEGLESVICDRFIMINSYKIKSLTNETRLEDPKNYYAEYADKVKAVTGRCCLSALENFQKLHQIYNLNTFETLNPRLSQILTPVLAIAKMADEKERMQTKKSMGEYERALMEFYETNIQRDKRIVRNDTVDGILEDIIPIIAMELYGLIPEAKREYTVTQHHKYKEAISFNRKEGWFELNILHFKCFIEEHMPGDSVNPRMIPKWVKSAFNIKESDIKRKMVTIENEELLKEFKGNTKTKVNVYRFYFDQYIGSNFLIDTEDEIEDDTEGEAKSIDDKLF